MFFLFFFLATESFVTGSNLPGPGTNVGKKTFWVWSYEIRRPIFINVRSKNCFQSLSEENFWDHAI